MCRIVAVVQSGQVSMFRVYCCRTLNMLTWVPSNFPDSSVRLMIPEKLHYPQLSACSDFCLLQPQKELPHSSKLSDSPDRRIFYFYFFHLEPQSSGLTKNVWMSCLFIQARGERIHLEDRWYLCLALLWSGVIEENCLDAAFGPPKKVKASIHESLREDEVEDWQSQRKEGKYCVRVRCLTCGWALWPGTFWNGLGSLHTARGGMERKTAKMACGKSQAASPSFLLTTQVNWALFESKKSSVRFLPLANAARWMA